MIKIITCVNKALREKSMKILALVALACALGGVCACSFTVKNGVKVFREQEMKRNDAISRLDASLASVKDKASADAAADEFLNAAAEVVKLTEEQTLLSLLKMSHEAREEAFKMMKEQTRWQTETMRRAEKRANELCAKKCYGSEKLQKALENTFCIVAPKNVPKVKPLPKR